MGFSRSASLLALLLTASLLAGCGFRADPEPLRQPLPHAVGQLKARQLGEAMQLSWLLPSRNQDGSEPVDLAGFLVYRSIASDDRSCPACGESTTPHLRIDLAYPDPAVRNGELMRWLDSDPASGSVYRYRVVPVTRENVPGEVARVAQPFLPPPPPPTGLTATGFDSLVRLSWQPPVEPPAGGELIGYHVYRGAADEALPLERITGARVESTGFEDGGVSNGRPYRYGVRGVYRQQESVFESRLSGIVGAVPVSGR